MSSFWSAIRSVFLSRDVHKVHRLDRKYYCYHVRSSNEWVLVKHDGWGYSLVDTANSLNELMFKCSILMKGVK